MAKINKLEAHHSFMVMPKDCNFNTNAISKKNDMLFGGKLMYEIDYAGSMIARRALYGVDVDTMVTASVDKINFEKPSFIGDIILMIASIKSLGKSSIQIRVKAIRENLKGETENVCSCNMTFVAIKDGKPATHNLSFETLEKDE